MATFGMNFMADLDEEQKQKLRGLDLKSVDLDEAASLELESSDRLTEYEINWLAEGKVTPVKD